PLLFGIAFCSILTYSIVQEGNGRMNWEYFNTLAYKLLKVAYINVLWILFSIVGLGIFGLFPATTAMYAVTRKLIIGESNFNIFSVFWGYFKKDFLKANGFGLIIVITAFILYFDFMFVVEKSNFQLLLPIFVFMLVAFIVTLI